MIINFYKNKTDVDPADSYPINVKPDISWVIKNWFVMYPNGKIELVNE